MICLLNRKLRHISLFLFALLLVQGCALKGPQPPCGDGFLNLKDCPPVNAKDDKRIAQLMDERRWRPFEGLTEDPLQVGIDAKIPIQSAKVKIIGPTQEESVNSIAAKIWMIEQAQHTIDATYYIFKRDLIGRAILGALCNAVKRGVDVWLIVDSVGSLHAIHSELKALVNCSAEGGFVKNYAGETTTRKARAQVVIFNALSKVFVRFNRRSHDKLLVVDGSFADKALVMTGGRNVSLDYYGLTADGQPDHNTFKDVEIIVKPQSNTLTDKDNVGRLSERYFGLLFLHKGNKRLKPWFAYRGEASQAQSALQRIKSFEQFNQSYDGMAKYLTSDFKEAKVRLAHELDNLENWDVVESYEENRDRNPNSIVTLLNRITREADNLKTIRVVSPYLFLPEYTGPTGKVIYDAKKEFDEWLSKDPERTIEIITNSVLTSDNFMAQSIIDMDMAPRLLLSGDIKEQWIEDEEQSELNPEFVKSEEWLSQVNNPRIKIYQLGKIDSTLLGGNNIYGKLHAKFMLSDEIGFVGTSNLDYRSRLFNNEFGFFFQSGDLQSELANVFEQLKAQSYLWGSDKWLAMRKKLRQADGFKGRWAKKQRTTFTRLRLTGLKWQI